MKIAYLGPAGSYTGTAALAAFGTAAESDLIPCASIKAVFECLASGAAARGLVPSENLIQGPVTETQDCLYEYAERVQIVDMLLQPIVHCLGARPGAPAPAAVLSKDQALKQCSDFLSDRFPRAELRETSSTSAAVATVAAAEPGIAAVAAESALREAGLDIIERNIGNVRSNATRFAVLAPADTPRNAATGRDATAFVLYPPTDRVGILEQMLAVISGEFGFSLSGIHSRPDSRGGFRFYLELEGHLDQQEVRACLARLGDRLQDGRVEIRVFGSYPRLPFVVRRIATVGIIGGEGRMGGWLAEFFRAASLAVVTAGISSGPDYEALVAAADVVLVNVPLDATQAVIAGVAPRLRPGQLLVDNSSVKEQPVALMEQQAAAGAEVLGMHTVFGPAVGSLRGQNVVFVRGTRAGELATEFSDLFYKYGARVTFASAQQHDRQMALHQNLEHVIRLALAKVLVEHFPDVDQVANFSSPNSRASLAAVGRVLNTDPALLAAIQTHNLQGPALIDAFAEAIASLQASMAAGDAAALLRFAAEQHEALGDAFVESMLERSRRYDDPD